MEASTSVPGSLWSVPESHSDRVDWPSSPAPPWRARVSATLWWHRATAAASSWAPPGKTMPLTVAMFVHYHEAPVGPYHEVLASPLMLAPSLAGRHAPAIAVPFIAVDSERSVHGGRTHWRLPKVLADFAGDVTRDVTASGDRWTVRAAVQGFGPGLPVVGMLPFAQPTCDGGSLRATVRLRGRARLARVEADAQGPTLSSWLTSGQHHGVVITDASLVVGDART